MNENIIKLLEDYIEALRKPKPFKYTNEQKAQAIEILMQENKELKEKAKNTMCLIGANYIHKDKVKEKIEELQEEFEYLGNDNKRVNKMTIEILQELLKEGGK